MDTSLSGINIIEVTWRQFCDTAWHLLELQGKEVAKGYSVARMRFNLDYTYIQRLEDAGNYFVLLAMHEMSNPVGPVGYVMAQTLYHPSYKHIHMGCITRRYVAPLWRSKGIGTEMLRMIETLLAKHGTQYVVVGEKSHLTYGKELERLGYKAIETNYGKWIGQAEPME